MRPSRDTRRNQGGRTDSSSGRPTMYSYYSAKSSAQQPDKPRRSMSLRLRLPRARMLPTILAVTVIAGSVLFSLTLSTTPVISFVAANEQSLYRPTEEYVQEAHELLQSRLGNRTKMTINTHAIEQHLMESYPEIAAVQLRLPVLGRKPTLVLDIREPAMVLVTDTKSYILDDSGMAIAEMRQLSAEIRQSLPILQDRSGLVAEVGKQAVMSSTIQFIKDLKLQFEARGLSISQLTLPAIANELDIRFQDIPYYVKTDTSGDARLQAGSYLAVKDHLDGQGITPAEYVDVRVEEKAFYK